MGRKATNTVPARVNSIRERIEQGRDQPQKEWRVEGEAGLVLVTTATGVGVFYLFYRNNFGKARKQRLGEFGERGPVTLAEAKALALKYRAGIEGGSDPFVEDKERREATTFQILAERFLEESPTLSATTRKNYRYTFKKDVYPFIGDKPAGAVTADDVMSICKRIEKSGASTQSERTKTSIGGVFRWALRERETGVLINPAKDIGRRSPKVARTRTPTDDEIGTLWRSMDIRARMSREMKLIVRLAILTGQRRTEVAGARLSELRLDDDVPTWTIPGDVNKRGKIFEGRTKNGREQVLPLSRQAVELFRQATNALGDEADYVFPADMKRVKKGKTPRTPHINGDSVTQAMARLRAKPEGEDEIQDAKSNSAKRASKNDAENSIEDISIHDMRRAISNWLKDQGIGREVRDLILNHKDSSVTEEHYSASARMVRQVGAAMQLWADHVWHVTGQATKADENVVRPTAWGVAV